jgi:aminoglycoside N3'-acetyltransferase
MYPAVFAAGFFRFKGAVYTSLQGIAHKKGAVSAELQWFFPVWERERLSICVTVAGTPDFSESADDGDVLELVWRQSGVHRSILASLFYSAMTEVKKNEKVHNILSCLLIVLF